jgi:hypothetical protein
VTKASRAGSVELALSVDPLDLTKRPPRSPRELLPGLELLMAARTVDKIRATLPGGNIGEYQITGFSSSLLNSLGIVEGALRAATARAQSDAEIAAWIREHSDPSTYPEINAKLEARTIGERLDDPTFVERYPVVRELPPETSRIDLLVADDAQAFKRRD